MTPEKSKLPDWVRRERQRDLEWIRENCYIFWPTAAESFDELGRGALVVDTTSRPTGEGNPFGYFHQRTIEQGDDEDIKRMVREYNPVHEFVVVLLKPEDRTSTYRVRPRNQVDEFHKNQSVY